MSTVLKSPELKNGIKIGELAELINAEINGSSEILIRSFCALNHPQPAGLAFSKSPRLKDIAAALAGREIGGVVVSKKTALGGGIKGVTFLLVDDPLASISMLTRRFASAPLPPPGISKLSDISSEATIGKGVHIGAFCSIGAGAHIGDHAVLFPHVVIYPGAVIGKNGVIHSGAVIRENCRVGDSCIVQNGAVIGADGFGYFLGADKQLEAVPQVGDVEISSHADIGANACIDRATLGTTRIGANTKIDNLVQIGHNTVIGRSSIVCGQTGIAGSCEIGDGVTLGGAVGVADHVKIASGIRVGGKSGVTGDLEEPGDYLGFPAIKAGVWRRQAKLIQQLPKLLDQIKSLLKKNKR